MASHASYVCPSGLARVVRRASYHPHIFLGWSRDHCFDVEELPVGAWVLVISSVASDLGWTPLLHREETEARFAWVHLETLRPVQHLSDGGLIRIGHFESRGSSPSTHWMPSVRPAVRLDVGTLMLDARWDGFGFLLE